MPWGDATARFISQNHKILGPRAGVLCGMSLGVTPGVQERLNIPALPPAFLSVPETSRAASPLGLEGPENSVLITQR